MKKIAKYLQLAARYVENPSALGVKLKGGIPGTYSKLNNPWFRNLQIQAVIDVGANEGQFARTLRSLLPAAQIYAFEPIPECLSVARHRFSSDNRIKFYGFALGDRKGHASFTIASGDTGASSLLEPANLQREYFPHTLNGRKIEVEIETLDNVMLTENLVGPYLLKIDVQGYEFQVLKGGMRIASKAKIILLEASHIPFYDGQPLFNDLYDLLRGYGFRLVDSFNMMSSPQSGEPLQGDFVFLR